MIVNSEIVGGYQPTDSSQAIFKIYLIRSAFFQEDCKEQGQNSLYCQEIKTIDFGKNNTVAYTVLSIRPIMVSQIFSSTF